MKKARRILSFFIALTICLSLVSCNNAAKEEKIPSKQDEKSTSTPLLYKVTDDDGNVTWLFGSIHIGRDDYYPLPDYVLDAYEDSDILAVEADIIEFEDDTEAQMDSLMLMVYRDGTKIDDHIPKKLYEDAKDIIDELDNYMSAYDMYFPVLWSSIIDSFFIEQLGGDSELGIDRHLLEKAKDDGKEIDEIESAEFQYGMMADFSEELQIFLLESSVESYNDKDKAKKEVERMMDLWASGDEKAFAEFIAEEDDEITEKEQEIYEEYQNAMMVERNVSMADYAEDALASGDEVFICVGAAHVIGEGAMAELLTERGYTVEKITG